MIAVILNLGETGLNTMTEPIFYESRKMKCQWSLQAANAIN